jgi:hypothetical protein
VIYAAMFCIIGGIIAMLWHGARMEQQLQQLRQEREECCGPK